MEGGAWWAAVHGVARSRTRLSDFPFTFHFHALEKEMATHSCSCLENPRDGGAWWAAFYGVAQSWTRLKWLSSSMVLFNRVLMILLSYIFTQLSLTFTFFLAWLHVYKIIIHLLISPIFKILILTCNTQWIPIFLLVYLCFIALLIF